MEKHSPAGNRTLVSRVTGGDTHHYTTEDTEFWEAKLLERHQAEILTFLK